MIMTISHHHTSKWKENRSTKPVIRRLPIRLLVELGMHTVLKLKSEFTFPVIDQNIRLCIYCRFCVYISSVCIV